MVALRVCGCVAGPFWACGPFVSYLFVLLVLGRAERRAERVDCRLRGGGRVDGQRGCACCAVRGVGSARNVTPFSWSSSAPAQSWAAALREEPVSEMWRQFGGRYCAMLGRRDLVRTSWRGGAALEIMGRDIAKTVAVDGCLAGPVVGPCLPDYPRSDDIPRSERHLLQVCRGPGHARMPPDA